MISWKHGRLGKWSLRTLLIAVVAICGIAIIGGGAYAMLLGANPTPAASSSVNLEKGLVGHWKLDGNAKDSTPNADNGTITGASTAADRKGQSAKAYTFGGSDYITVPYASVLMPTVVTASSWIYPTDISSANFQTVVSTKESGGYALFVSGTSTQTGCPVQSVCFVVYSGGDYRAATVDKTLSNNTWYHLAGTYDGTVVKLYINGSLVASSNYTGSITASTSPLCIGAEAGASACNGGDNFNGRLDGVRVYNRALNSTEVTALHQQYDTAVRLGAGEDGLLGHWKFDGNAKDASPYAGNGTVAGAVALTTDRKGVSNSAYSFSGSSGNYITLTGASAYDSAKVTVSAWVLANTYTSTMTAVSRYDSVGPYSGNWVLGQGSTANTWRFMATIGGSSYSATSATNFSTGVWHHLVGVYDGSNVILYVDGTATATTPIVGSLASGSGTALRIGSKTSNDARWNGKIDDVRIWNRGLTATEIARQAGTYNANLQVSTLQSKLLGQWPFNGNAKDASPYAGNGTVTGATLTTDAKGISDRAYAFSGSSQYITLPGSGVQPTDAISLAAWIKPANLSAAAIQTVLSTAETGGYFLGTTDASSVYTCGTIKICFSLYSGGAYHPAAAARSLLSNGQWNLLVATYDGSLMKLYVNGELADATGVYAPISYYGSPANPLCIGSDSTSSDCTGGNYFNGSIDDVRVWQRALSDNEVVQLYKLYK